MAETEQVPLLNVVDESTLPPPPPYHPTEPEVETKPEGTAKPAYPTDKAIPLPTYEQSQKYEQDGVLQIEEEEPDVDHNTQRATCASKPPGTCLDFTMFFLLCSFFGLIGFIFSICLAFTTAAEAGALAGLGTALIMKLFAFETYDTVKYYDGGCEMYYGNTDHTKEICMRRLFYLTRLFFWFLGIFGLFLICKGFHRYAQSRKQRRYVAPSPESTDSD